ncbi:MAG TPA: serine protease [Solirubrobacterales bacterium]|nr:serine protease [Solirubrobacterales bacterium]
MTSARGRIRVMIIATAVALISTLGPAGSATASPDASASIINGNPASIGDWPWQVAIASSTSKRPGQSPFYRTFCGGSIVAPTVILTASHCALDMYKGEVGDYTVISGRTNLNNQAAGQEVFVTGIYFPRTSNGKILYKTRQAWDVSLLTLEEPLAGQPVKLLGPDEHSILKPGRRLIETGWGSTITGRDVYPKTLKMGGTNIQPPSVCHGLLGSRYFKPSLQVCLGDAKANQANCYGDSGGPAVVATSAGYRQVGVTSFGTADNCAGLIPNVDVLVGGGPVRDWIQAGVQVLGGVDPVGSSVSH